MFNKIYAFIAALSITATTAGMLPASTEDNSFDSVVNASSEYYNGYEKVDLSTSKYFNAVENKIDIMNDPHFPVIENQGNWGSCTSFTTAYYQFSYEARKAYYDKYGCLPNIRFSPAYTYRNMSGGNCLRGTSIVQTYAFLNEHGALLWENDKYDTTSNINNRVTDARILSKGLKYRLNDFDYKDTLYPEFDWTEAHRLGLAKRLVFKYRRWKAGSWKRELCYGESNWESFWNGVWNHLLKPASI